MRKWIQIIKFINKYRRLGIGNFKIMTTGDIFILVVDSRDRDGKIQYHQLRIKQKFWRA